MNREYEKVAVVTGGTSGLGLAMACKFRAEGFRTVACARREPAEGMPDAVEFECCDLLNEADRSSLPARILKRFGRIDVWINNAGSGAYATWEELPESELRKLFELDFFAPVLLARAVLPELRRTGGTLIDIASVAGLTPVACMGAYSAAKAALAMASRTQAMEQFHVRVLTVYPGRIDTGFSTRSYALRNVGDTPGNHSSSPGVLANKVFHAYCTKKETLIYPLWYCLPIAVARLFPRLAAYGNRKFWKLNGKDQQ